MIVTSWRVQLEPSVNVDQTASLANFRLSTKRLTVESESEVWPLLLGALEIGVVIIAR